MDGEEGRRREEVGKREREGGKEGEGERKQTLALRKKFSKPHSNHNEEHRAPQIVLRFLQTDLICCFTIFLCCLSDLQHAERL